MVAILIARLVNINNVKNIDNVSYLTVMLQDSVSLFLTLIIAITRAEEHMISINILLSNDGNNMCITPPNIPATYAKNVSLTYVSLYITSSSLFIYL